MGRASDCDACRKQHELDGVPPPCGSPECEKPGALFPANVIPWKIWQTAHQFDRPTRMDFIVTMAGAQSVASLLPLPAHIVSGLCEIYGQGVEAFERIMWFEAEVFPLIQEREKSGRGQAGAGPGENGDE